MLVRGVRTDELENLKDLRLRALLDTPEAFGRRHEEELDRDAGEYLGWVTEGGTFVVEDGTGWHGLVSMLIDAEDPSLCHLFSMWIAPSHRRGGLGRILVDAGLRWAEDQGATRVRLGVVEDNWPAIGLYRRAGFAPTGEREPLQSHPERSVVFMTRDLVVDA